MKRLIGLVVGTVLVAGCAGLGARNKAVTGQTAFSAMQAAVAASVTSAADSVVLVKLNGIKSGNSRVISIGSKGSSSSRRQAKTLTGIILTTNGYVIVAEGVKPDDVTRIEVWVGDDEYRGKIVKSDDQLDMSIIKIDADVPLTPLDIANTDDLQLGGWCVGVQPSGEEYDYETFASLAFCRGQVEGHYRQYLLDNATGIKDGAPIMSPSGRVIGIVHKRGHVLAMQDLREDLLTLLDDAQGVKSADEEAKRKSWFGCILKPINKQYARKHGLPESAIWVLHAMQDAPAASAGVRTGDLLVGVNGRDIRFSGMRAHRFFMKTLRPRVDDPFTVTVLRDGETIMYSGVFSEKPEDDSLRADDLGITVEQIDPGSVVARNLFSDHGVYITDIRKGSAAAVGSNLRSSLLEKGDIITALNGQPTPDLEAFSAVLEQLRRDPPSTVLIAYLRGRATGFAALNLQIGERENKSE